MQLIVNDGIAGSAPDTVTITANLPTPRFAYVADANSGSISRFAINASTGALTTATSKRISTDGHLQWHEYSKHASGSERASSGRFAYAAASMFNFRVFGVTTDAETGALTSIRAPLSPSGVCACRSSRPIWPFCLRGDSNLRPMVLETIRGSRLPPGRERCSPPFTGSPFPTGISPGHRYRPHGPLRLCGESRFELGFGVHD